MITLASFVVIPQYTFAANHISKTVFEWMLRRRDRLRDSPHGHFSKCIGSKDNPTANEWGSFYVGDYDNMLHVLSMSPTIFTFQVRQNAMHTAKSAG